MLGSSPNPRDKLLKKGERIMAVNNVFNDIKKDVAEYTANVSKFAAIETREELFEESRHAIAVFYADYTPGDYHRRFNELGWIQTDVGRTYQRTYNLYNSYKKYYKNNHDRTFSGGVILSPEYMDDVYRGTPELVFDLAYAGFHGLNSWEPDSPRPATPYAVTNPSPLEIIEEKQSSIANNPEPILHKAIIKANAQKYLYF